MYRWGFIGSPRYKKELPCEGWLLFSLIWKPKNKFILGYMAFYAQLCRRNYIILSLII